MELPIPYSPPIRFTSSPVAGAGRGKKLNVPTINLDLHTVPSSLQHGVYACLVSLDSGKTWLQSATHYGPRPVFQDSVSFEVHLLDTTVATAPKSIQVQVIARLRDVQNFPGPEELKAAIAQDISQTRAILGSV
ncbi:MAG: riboflavin kinase [Candidatus Peribacteraceae bacterium]|nr:riboflavin kinase [Candidatus Peribacteraceae bacterium]